MKPARFIFNSDYATIRTREHKELSITIPNYIEYSIPSYESSEYKIGELTYTKANDDDFILVYFTSSKYDYMMFGRYGDTQPDGATCTVLGDPSGAWIYNEDITFDVRQNGSQIKFRILCLSKGGGSGVSFRYQGYGQTITAHILTFKDPFSE